VSRAVYEIDEGPNAGRFVVAQWLESNACYVADMTTHAKRLTGCSQVSSRTLRGIAGASGVTVYRSRASAQRALRRAQEWE
jgi:hypothetical protein